MCFDVLVFQVSINMTCNCSCQRALYVGSIYLASSMLYSSRYYNRLIMKWLTQGPFISNGNVSFLAQGRKLQSLMEIEVNQFLRLVIINFRRYYFEPLQEESILNFRNWSWFSPVTVLHFYHSACSSYAYFDFRRYAMQTPKYLLLHDSAYALHEPVCLFVKKVFVYFGVDINQVESYIRSLLPLVKLSCLLARFTKINTEIYVYTHTYKPAF